MYSILNIIISSIIRYLTNHDTDKYSIRKAMLLVQKQGCFQRIVLLSDLIKNMVKAIDSESMSAIESIEIKGMITAYVEMLNEEKHLFADLLVEEQLAGVTFKTREEAQILVDKINGFINTF